ncbi:MAG: molybdopterin-dependent oxidoreductase [Polyangiaceae bacterium]
MGETRETGETTTHYRVCPLCDAMCGLAINTEDGRVKDIRGDKENVFSRGHICPKGPALRDFHDDPDRLRRPVRRVGSVWEPISSRDALDEAANRLSDVRAKHGADAVAFYVGNPVAHNYAALLGIPILQAALGTKNHYDTNSQDGNPKIFACMKMYGDGLSLTIPDVDRTRYLLILGANPAASNGSMLTMGDARARLRGIRERGGRIVLVDPGRTESADWSDEHHWIRPGGDAAFVLAILHVIFAEDLADVASLAKSTRGLAALRGCAQRFPPHRVAEAVGIAPATITRIARELARAEAAVAYCRVGVCQSELGLVASWLVEALNVVTGNFDRPGGMMFTKPAADIGPLARAAVGNHHGRWRSRVRGLPEFLGSFPSGALLEEMTTPGPGQIRALVTLAGNPVLSIPGGARLADALARLDAVVSIDPYVNETTRHAHVILPPASPLETSHFDLLFNAVSVRNTVSYSEPVLPRSDDALDDYEILTGLAKRLAGRRAGDGATGRTIERALEKLLPSTDDALALLFRLGPYGDHFVPGRQGLTLAKVREAPHGIDLGPLVPMGRERVRTPDGRVDLAPEVLLADVSRVETWLAERRNGGLLLIGRRHLRSNNSWMHNLRSLVKGPDRSALLVHPDDAARHGLVEGATCRVKSRAGEVRARVAITRDIMPGVVSLPHGYGHAAAADTLHVAGPLPGANINVLTDETWVEPILGNSILTGIPVSVEREP